MAHWRAYLPSFGDEFNDYMRANKQKLLAGTGRDNLP
jgi:hypothetical protein